MAAQAEEEEDKKKIDRKKSEREKRGVGPFGFCMFTREEDRTRTSLLFVEEVGDGGFVSKGKHVGFR